MVSTTRNHSTVNSKETRPDGNRDGSSPSAPLNESSKSIASFTPLARLNTPHQALTSDETWGLLFATAMLRRLLRIEVFTQLSTRNNELYTRQRLSGHRKLTE